MKLDAQQGMRLILKALENDNQDKLYLKWLHDSANHEMSFKDYIKAHQPYRKSTKEEKEEILKKWGG